MARQPSCLTRIYWSRGGKLDHLRICRRFPPTGMDGWSYNKIDDWCGEHVEREEDEAGVVASAAE